MKTDTTFQCNECGKQLLKWMGKCPGCGAWNSIEEKKMSSAGGPSRPATGTEDELGAIRSLGEIPEDSHSRLITGSHQMMIFLRS